MQKKVWSLLGALALAAGLSASAGGCAADSSSKSMDEPLDKSDALRADEAMRNSAQDLVREKGGV